MLRLIILGGVVPVPVLVLPEPLRGVGVAVPGTLTGFFDSASSSCSRPSESLGELAFSLMLVLVERELGGWW